MLLKRGIEMGSIKLSDAFVAETIANIKPHWGTLGWVTYKRTYARWNEQRDVQKNGMRRLSV